jgi:hypothetical protein
MASEQVDVVRKEIEVSPEELELLRAEAQLHPGAEIEVLEEPESIAPLVIIAVIGGAAFVAGAIDYILDRRHGGMVIDLQKGATKREYRSTAVRYGLVVIYAADGTVKVEVHEPKGFFGQVVDSVLEALKGIVTDSAKAIADAAKEAAGDKADVHTGDPETPPPAPAA